MTANWLNWAIYNVVIGVVVVIISWYFVTQQPEKECENE